MTAKNYQKQHLENQKCEDFLIFVETSPIIIYECFCGDKNAYHWL